MSARLSSGGNTAHVHCGGFYNGDQPTSTCYAINSEARPVQLSLLKPLPGPRSLACSASDGKRLVMAGGTAGRADEGGALDDVIFLANMEAKW